MDKGYIISDNFKNHGDHDHNGNDISLFQQQQHKESEADCTVQHVEQTFPEEQFDFIDEGSVNNIDGNPDDCKCKENDGEDANANGNSCGSSNNKSSSNDVFCCQQQQTSKNGNVKNWLSNNSNGNEEKFIKDKKHGTSFCYDINNPFRIWKLKFMWDYQCAEKDIYKELFYSAIPHISAFLLVALYILFGTLIFIQIDDSLRNRPFHELLLFSFSTITTIGWGNIVPQTVYAKLFCVAFCIVGIPFVFLTLSKMGELFTEFYWICVASIRKQVQELVLQDVPRLPLPVVTLILLLHSVIGGLMFHFLFDDMPITPAIYFSFISITTIGFGDIYPKPKCLLETLLIIVYLSAGISIISTIFGTISDHLRRIHYLGRNFEGTENVRIWFAGSTVSIRELVQLVAKQFQVSPLKLREVLKELDVLIQLNTIEAHRRNCSDCCELRHEQHAGDNDHLQAIPDIEADDCSNAELSSLNTEQEEMIQALSTLHRLSIKGVRTFRSSSLNTFTLHSSRSQQLELAAAARQIRECNNIRNLIAASPYATVNGNAHNALIFAAAAKKINQQINCNLTSIPYPIANERQPDAISVREDMMKITSTYPSIESMTSPSLFP